MIDFGNEGHPVGLIQILAFQFEIGLIQNVILIFVKFCRFPTRIQILMMGLIHWGKTLPISLVYCLVIILKEDLNRGKKLKRDLNIL